MKKQVHVFFSGRVQGVGFRFSAVHLAEELGVSGWVKNLDDGQVEVVAESDEEQLQLFLERLRQTFSRYIRDVQAEWLDAAGRYPDFQVRF